MSSMKKLEYSANIKEKLENKKLGKISDKIELHHPIGRKNSNDVVPLCNPCHEFITIQQNSLSVPNRKDKLIFALKSVQSMHNLSSKHLGLVIEKLIEEDKNEKEQDSSKSIHKTK